MLVAILAIAGVAFAGCGSKSSSSSGAGASGGTTTGKTHFAKTKFVLHAGLAFGAFHRWVYKPYMAGSLKKGAPGRTKALIKAGAASLFAAHELKQARRAALSDDRLRPLATKVDALARRLGPLAAALKGGSFNPADIIGAAGAVSALGSGSAAAGAAVKDRTP